MKMVRKTFLIEKIISSYFVFRQANLSWESEADFYQVGIGPCPWLPQTWSSVGLKKLALKNINATESANAARNEISTRGLEAKSRERMVLLSLF